MGDLRFVLEQLPVLDAAVVAAGDNIFCFDLYPLWQALRVSGRSYVFALEERDPAELRRTGVLELAADLKVLALAEKPAEPRSNWACPSFYALNRPALAAVGPYLAAGQPRDEIGRFIAHLVKTQEIYAQPTRGQRLHVGNPAELAKANAALQSRS